jgi:hypothetical protein
VTGAHIRLRAPRADVDGGGTASIPSRPNDADDGQGEHENDESRTRHDRDHRAASR